MPRIDCRTSGDSARITPAATFVSIRREIFGGLLLTLQQVTRRLESHAKHPGVVDSTVLASSRREIIQGAALLRIADQETAQTIGAEITQYAAVLTMLRTVRGELAGVVDSDIFLGSPVPEVSDVLCRLLERVEQTLEKVDERHARQPGGPTIAPATPFSTDQVDPLEKARLAEMHRRGERDPHARVR